MTFDIFFAVPISILLLLAAYFLGRSRGFATGYALGIKVADAWERTANILQRKLDAS